METMSRYPGRTLRGTRYYLRTRVPVDLTATIGRREIWKSLDTGNHREAVRRFHLAKAELDAWFDARRRRQAALSNDEARRLASDWLQATDRRNAHDDFALSGPDHRIALDETERELAELLAGLDGEHVRRWSTGR
jgi:hypothetical protein